MSWQAFQIALIEQEARRIQLAKTVQQREYMRQTRRCKSFWRWVIKRQS